VSPETPFNDQFQVGAIDQYFPGVNQFPTVSLSDFPIVSPKTGLVESVPSETKFPSVSPGKFPSVSLFISNPYDWGNPICNTWFSYLYDLLSPVFATRKMHIIYFVHDFCAQNL